LLSDKCCCLYCVVDLPAGFYSDDEYISEEDEKDNDLPVLLPTRKFQGLRPPPTSQDNSRQSSVKDTSETSLPTVFQWSRNTCALRAPGTDPMKLRKDHVTANASKSGKEAVMNNPAALAKREHCTNRDRLDDSAPFGVARRHRAKVQEDTANWAWVEHVLKLKSEEATAPQGSTEV